MDRPDQRSPKLQVFISYAKEDASAAARLSESIKAVGIDTWLDQERLLAGQHWGHEIRRAIQACDYFVALLSTHSLSKRGFVQRELKQALSIIEELPEFREFLIPVRLDDCVPENETLRGIQWVDLFPQWEIGLHRLLVALQSQDSMSTSLRSNIRAETIEKTREKTVPLGEQLGLPSAVLEDFLQINLLARRRYRGNLACGAAMISLAFLVALVGQYLGIDLNDDEAPNTVALSALGSICIIGGSYFLIRGWSRWSTSYRARKLVVKSNNISGPFLQRDHPWIYKALFGNWFFRIAFTAGRTLLVGLFLMLSLIALVGILAVVNGDLFGLLALAVSIGASTGAIWPAIRFQKAWRTAQRLAGIPGYQR